MTTGPEHLAAEHKQLVKFLDLYPSISIVGINGEPPDEYEIAYNLRGYTSTEKGIEVTRNHRIQITLPFGYPHAAPVVKALTPLFHPAINQNDISVEAQWGRKPSLSELILYIAEIITAHIYDVENSVNEEASRWYEAHKKDLPLDTASIVNMEEDGLIGLLEGEFDPALNLREELSSDLDQYNDAEIDEIRDLLARNQLYTAAKRLADLPPDLWFPERGEAEHRLETARQEAAQLFTQAQELEDQSRYGKALECAHAILAIIPDEPAAKALVQRLQQSSFITDSLSDALNEQEDVALDLQPDDQQTPGPATDEKPRKGPRKALLPEGFPLRRVAMVILGIVLLLWGGIQAMNEWSIMSRIQKGIREGRNQLQAKQYADAKDTLERTRRGVGNLALLWFRESALQNEIDNLLNTPELKEGAQGRVLYQGTYVDEAAVRSMEELAQLKQQAQKLAENKQYDEALLLYNKALQRTTVQNLTQDKEHLGTIILSLKAEKLLDQATLAEQQHKWDEAMDLYQQVQMLLLDPDAPGGQLGSKVAERLVGAQLRQKIISVHTALEADQLEAACSHVQEAEQLLAANPASVSAQDAQQLDSARVQLEMYAILPAAKRAFEERQWQRAALLYAQAIALVDNSSPDVQSALREVRAKIARTLDLTHVNQSLDELRVIEAKKDWPTVVRLKSALITRINQSAHAGDPELAAIRQRLVQQLAGHRQELDMHEKRQWLESRALDFFRSSYPTIQETAFSNPKATFLRREGTKQIFELSSLDSSGGRPSKLVLLYAFDEKNGQWAPFRE